MVKREKKDLNALFGKNLLVAAVPDDYWVLPNEMIGFELECEDFERAEAAGQALRPEWKSKGDGSLRNGIEWILNGPHSGTKLRKAILKLFPNEGFRYNMSERTSTHIHINMSDGLVLEQLRAMFALVYLIEPAIFRWADENRKWCSYCCPLSDMAPSRLAVLLNDDNNGAIEAAFTGARHEDKYYGFNIKSFLTHGTVEFRYFPCTNQRKDAFAWIQFVMEVKKAAVGYDSVATLLAEFDSPRKVEAFIRKHFTVNADNVLPRLDIRETIQRAGALEALLDVQPAEVEGDRRFKYKQVHSVGFKKMLKSVFNKDLDVEALAPIQDVVADYANILDEEERGRMYAYWDAKARAVEGRPQHGQLLMLRDKFLPRVGA